MIKNNFFLQLASSRSQEGCHSTRQHTLVYPETVMGCFPWKFLPPRFPHLGLGHSWRSQHLAPSLMAGCLDQQGGGEKEGSWELPCSAMHLLPLARASRHAYLTDKTTEAQRGLARS